MGHPLQGRITASDRRSMITLLNECDGDLELARYAVEYAAREFPNMKTTSGVLQGNYPERARQQHTRNQADKAAAERAAEARTRRLAEENQQHQKLEQLWRTLPTTEREQLLAEARAWLRKTVKNVTQWSDETIDRTATLRAKKELANRLADSKS